jgi:hypothetical protein
MNEDIEDQELSQLLAYMSKKAIAEKLPNPDEEETPKTCELGKSDCDCCGS